MAQFSMLERVPAGHTFRDTDGQVYQVKSARMFGTTAYGRLLWLQDELPSAMQEVSASGGDEAALLPAVTRMDATVNEWMQLLIPELPIARIHEIPLESKVNFILWWQAEEQRAAPQGEARAARATSGKRSRGSSSKATTRSAS